MYTDIETATAAPQVLSGAYRQRHRRTVHVLSVAVEVFRDQRGGATFTYNGESSLVVNVPHGEIWEICFQLDAGSGSFTTFPINWFSGFLRMGGQPTPAPSTMEVSREGRGQVEVLDLNQEPGTFHLTLSVLLDGAVYTGTDPTIINHPDG